MKAWLVFNPGQPTVTVMANDIMMPHKEQPIVVFLGEGNALVGVAHVAPGGTVMERPAQR